MAETILFDHVLLIEDDQGHAFLIKRALGGYVRDIEVKTNLPETLAVLSETKFDLLITDLHLSGNSSVQHIAPLKQASNGAPIIVLTSSTSLKDAVDAMKLGAQDFLVKNFDGGFKESLALALSRVFSAMLVERERRRFQREMETLREAIENSADGLAVVEPDGSIEYRNSAFSNFIKLCGGESTHISTLFATPVARFELVRDSVMRSRENLAPGGVWHTEVLLADVKDAAYDLMLSGIHPGNAPGLVIAGELPRCVVWVRDISEVKHRERFQREILSTTTHDLKGPLGAIVLSSELLTQMLDPGTKSHSLAVRVGSSAQGAVNLIDEFLSARRIQEGNFILRPTDQNVVELVEEVSQNYDAIASSKSIELKIESGQAGIQAKVDKLGFSRALGNLISNALKFTPKGGRVVIGVNIVGGDLVVRVQDSGSGMEPGEVQKIFGRFSRLSRHSEVAGTGLGLFVVRSVVNAHGGKIEVSSRLGEGSVFELTFPANPPINDRGELICLDFA